MAEPQTATTSTDTGQVSYADFAAKIRSKYPDSKLYKSKPDKELVDAWIQAKPERAVYKNKLKPVEDKKEYKDSDNPYFGADKTKQAIESNQKTVGLSVVDAVSKSLPAVGGAGYGMAGKRAAVGVPMAGLGGMAGAASNEIIQRFVFSRSGADVPTGSKEDTNLNTVKYILKEGAEQAALEGAGRGVGHVFFNLLNKIPHAIIKDGIKLLPSDMNPNGRVMKYVEDLLSNLAPSANTMEKFKAAQSAEITKKVNTIVEGFSRFNGTSEEMGVLLKNTLQTGQDAIEDKLSTLEKTYIKKGASKLQAQQYVRQTAIYKDYVQRYENELVQRIVATNKPELIAGLLRSSKAALNETRVMSDTLKSLDGNMLGKVQNRIMRDVINETLQGSKDPTAKGVQNLTAKYSGAKFKDILDGIKEEKLKAIYGDVGYKNIEEFVKLTGNIGNGGGTGLGRFLNLTFLLPFRSGLTGKAIMKTTGTAFLLNRAAKVITSTEGMRLYENIIRATAANVPRATKLAMDEYNNFLTKQDEEFKAEQKQTEDQYYKDHPDEVKYRNKEN